MQGLGPPPLSPSSQCTLDPCTIVLCSEAAWDAAVSLKLLPVSLVQLSSAHNQWLWGERLLSIPTSLSLLAFSAALVWNFAEQFCQNNFLVCFYHRSVHLEESDSSQVRDMLFGVGIFRLWLMPLMSSVKMWEIGSNLTWNKKLIILIFLGYYICF